MEMVSLSRKQTAFQFMSPLSHLAGAMSCLLATTLRLAGNTLTIPSFFLAYVSHQPGSRAHPASVRVSISYKLPFPLRALWFSGCFCYGLAFRRTHVSGSFSLAHRLQLHIPQRMPPTSHMMTIIGFLECWAQSEY